MRKAETIRCDGDWRCRVGCAWPTMTSVGGRSLPPVPPCDCDWTVAFLHYSFTERERVSPKEVCVRGGVRRRSKTPRSSTPRHTTTNNALALLPSNTSHRFAWLLRGNTSVLDGKLVGDSAGKEYTESVRNESISNRGLNCKKRNNCKLGRFVCVHAG